MKMILGVMSLPWQGGGGLAGSLKSYSSLGTGETITINFTITMIITTTITITILLLGHSSHVHLWEQVRQ